MKLFGKKNQVDTVPQEVREYYESERRERTGMAWLLAVGTLVVTLLLASGLFFGGRWVFRTVFDNDNKKQPVATQEEKKTEEQKPEPKKPETKGGTGNSTAGTTTPQAARTDTPSTATTTRPATPSTGATTLPSSGATTLVSTGPAEVAMVFVTVVAAGTLYHRFVLTPLKRK